MQPFKIPFAKQTVNLSTYDHVPVDCIYIDEYEPLENVYRVLHNVSNSTRMHFIS